MQKMSSRGFNFHPPLCEVHQGSMKTLKSPSMMILSGAFICCLMLVVGQSGPREFLKGGRGGILEVTTPQVYKPTPTPTPPAVARHAGLDSGVYIQTAHSNWLVPTAGAPKKNGTHPQWGGHPTERAGHVQAWDGMLVEDHLLPVCPSY